MLAPRIGLDGVQRMPSEAGTPSDTTVPRLGSTSPRPERARMRASQAETDSNQPRLQAAATALNAKRSESIKRGSSPSLARGAGAPVEEQDSCSVALPPFTAVRKCRTYTAGVGFDAARIVSTVAVSCRGDYFLWGDRGGRIFVMDREKGITARGEPFGALAMREAYAPFVDPLHSVDVSPAVNAAAFIPQVGPTVNFLTANQGIPKMWKLTSACTSLPEPFRAVDRIGSRVVGPLTVPDEPSVVCKEVAKYIMDHEHGINAILPSPDGLHFYTVDDLTIRLWASEMTQLSLDVLSIKPCEGDEVKESFTTAATSVRDPSLIMCCTTAGFVRVMDTRCGLRLSGDDELRGAALTLRNPPRAFDGAFMQVACSMLGVTASPCGKYVVGRDFNTVQLWDLRKASGTRVGDGSAPGNVTATSEGHVTSLVRRWAVDPTMQARLDDVYQAGLLFEKLPIGLVNGGSRWVTGGFNGTVVSGSLYDTAADADSATLVRQSIEPQEGDANPPQDPYSDVAAASTVRRASVAEPRSEARSITIAEALDETRAAVTTCAATGDCFAAMGQDVHHFEIE